MKNANWSDDRDDDAIIGARLMKNKKTYRESNVLPSIYEWIVFADKNRQKHNSNCTLR